MKILLIDNTENQLLELKQDLIKSRAKFAHVNGLNAAISALSKHKFTVVICAAIVDKNSSVIVIPPIIGQDLSNSAAFVNPLDSISDGISLIESKGGKFVDTNESCLPLKKKRIKYISKNLKINGKRPNICDSNLFKVLTVKSNLLPHPNNGLKQKNNTGGGDDDVDGNGP